MAGMFGSECKFEWNTLGEYLIVNGGIAVLNDEQTPERAGRVL